MAISSLEYQRLRRSGNWKRQYRTPEQVMERDEFGRKMCKRCEFWLSEDEFTSNTRTSDGLQSMCRPCLRFRTYGLNRRCVDEMLEAQGRQCPICDRGIKDYGDFMVDHDNRCCNGFEMSTYCGKCTRGLICVHCNVRVLPVLEATALVERARAYLDRGKSRD